jgi:long-chain fatty acid transport protein
MIMKKVLMLSSIGVSLLYSTNGDHLYGIGAESRALGGTGIANYIGSENALTNPALLNKSDVQTEFSFGGTFFQSDVDVKTTAGNGTDGMMIPGSGTTRTSDEGASVIPSVSLYHKLENKGTFGLGMYGTAGMGTDWRSEDTPFQADINNPGLMNIGLYNMRSSLTLMEFAPSYSFGKKNWGIGITGIIQYGSLGIDFDTYDSSNSYARKHVGNGSSSDYGFGVQLGGYYDINQDLTIGASYKSGVEMEYKDQLSAASRAFGMNFSDELEQPAEYGIGLSYKYNKFTLSGDIKNIRWGDAKGYSDFGWENQIVYALGLKYTDNNYWLGVGYNYGENPIKNNDDTTLSQSGINRVGDTLNLFNYVMFPAIIEKTYSVGGGYNISKNMSANLSYAFSPAVSKTVTANTVGVGSVTTEHSQSSVSFAVRYKF